MPELPWIPYASYYVLDPIEITYETLRIYKVEIRMDMNSKQILVLGFCCAPMEPALATYYSDNTWKLVNEEQNLRYRPYFVEFFERFEHCLQYQIQIPTDKSLSDYKEPLNFQYWLNPSLNIGHITALDRSEQKRLILSRQNFVNVFSLLKFEKLLEPFVICAYNDSQGGIHRIQFMDIDKEF
jgi:hypothetical protein